MRRHLQLLVIALALSAPGVAHARREASFAYPFTRVWPTVVRLLRVDFECQITEKDKEDGYFFFDYADHGKTFPGSVELVTTKEAAGESVRVVVQVPAMPSYVEAMVLDKLSRKLIEQFGAPRTAVAPPAEAAPNPDDAQPNPADGKQKPATPNQPAKPTDPGEPRRNDSQRN